MIAYTASGVKNLKRGHMSFAGQRDDGFYADIQSIFDLDFAFDKPDAFDSQGGYNVHTIVLNIPLAELDGAKIAGVYATTHRPDGKGRKQVGRQGNPLFAEAFIAIKDKNLYNRTKPTADDAEFRSYAANPELAAALSVTPLIPGLLEAIYIPDLIKVDLTTPPARLAGQAGFHRLSVFGGDTLLSTFQDPFANGGNIPGGWPNGRRFGDDVIDIGIIALGAAPAGRRYRCRQGDANDITYNEVFPYAATPLNGRNHGHHYDRRALVLCCGLFAKPLCTLRNVQRALPLILREMTMKAISRTFALVLAVGCGAASAEPTRPSRSRPWCWPRFQPPARQSPFKALQKELAAIRKISNSQFAGARGDRTGPQQQPIRVIMARRKLHLSRGGPMRRRPTT